MLGQCTYVRVVYFMLGRCSVCYGGILCVMAVYCLLWKCTVC